MPAATVWIPATTSPEHRALLSAGVDVREVPATGDISYRPQHADIIISGFNPQRTIEILPQLRDLRVVQTLSAGVDALVDHIPAGVILCDGSGIHDASVSEWVVMATLAMRRHLPDFARVLSTSEN